MQSPIAQVQVTDFDRALLNRAFKTGTALGRKFEALDMTPELRNAAKLYASIFRPTDEGFMADMYLRAISGFLSDGQSKGVLNVMMADARRRLAAKRPQAESATPAVAVKAVLANVPDGRYRVTQADGDHLAIRISAASKDGKLAGSRIVSVRQGEDWEGVAHVSPDGEFRFWRSTAFPRRPRIQATVDVLDSAEGQDGWLVAGLAFAQAGSQCFICGRDLDTPESLTAGYGPVCAEKLGLPWGAKAVPMSVRLAQAEAAPAASASPLRPCLLAHTDDQVCDRCQPAPTVEPTPNFSGLTEIAEKVADRIIARKEDPNIAEAARQLQTIATAQAEGRKRTYAEIFGEED